jgi:hypothetical protein
LRTEYTAAHISKLSTDNQANQRSTLMKNDGCAVAAAAAAGAPSPGMPVTTKPSAEGVAAADAFVVAAVDGAGWLPLVVG